MVLDSRDWVGFKGGGIFGVFRQTFGDDNNRSQFNK